MPDATRREAALRQLESDGLLERRGAELRTTRRWQSALARAAVRLADASDPERGDVRIAIVDALVEIYGDGVDEDDLTELALAVLPFELSALGSSARSQTP